MGGWGFLFVLLTLFGVLGTFSRDGKVIELHAYEIASYTGEIQLRVHDDMHWVPVADLPAHPQLPADLIVSHALAK